VPDPYPQRNPGSAPVDVPAIPATVGPGEVVSWPWSIAGFERVEPAPDPVPESPAKPKARTAAPEGVTDDSARA
jgi:hypothetical protein